MDRKVVEVSSLSLSSLSFSDYLPTYLPIDLSTYLSIHPSICLCIYLSTARLPQFLNLTTSKTQQFSVTSSMFAFDKVKNKAILRDFPIFKVDNDNIKKRSISARLPICFKVHNMKNEADLRDVLQKWKVECRADGLVPKRFVIFQSTCLKYCASHEKVIPGHSKCCTCHAKSSQQT